MSNALHNTHKVMKCTKFINRTAATLLLAVVTGVGCKKNPQGVTPLLGRGPTTVGDERSKPIDVGDGANAGLPLPEHLKDWPVAADQPAVLRDNTVYFDYDSSNVRRSETSKLDAIASYIKGGGNRAIRVEGHADARGTEEYNRALGEKRAQSVREYLARAGVSAN